MNENVNTRVQDIPKASKNSICLVGLVDGVPYSDILEQSEILATPEQVENIERVVLLDNEPPMVLVSDDARQLINKIVAHNKNG